MVLCDALSVRGVVSPVSPNPAPVTEACETVTLEPPVLVNVTVCDCWSPTVTLPKASLLGLSVSEPGVDAAVPVPVRLRLAVFEALLVTVTDALKVPTEFGANVMLTGVLCPAARVTGRPGAVREKYWVEIATPLIITVADPEFVAVADRVLLVPAVTLPKFNVADERDREPDATWTEEPALKPWQPVRKERPATTSSAAATLTCFAHLLVTILGSVNHGIGTQDPKTVWSGGRLIPNSFLLASQCKVDTCSTGCYPPKGQRQNVPCLVLLGAVPRSTEHTF